MKIYFMSSPRGKKDHDKNYASIYKAVEELGHTHTTKFLINVDASKFYLTNIDDFFEETLKDLKRADVCIFEASIPSLAIGYLVNEAIKCSKPVIIFHTGEYIPHFLMGIHDENVQIVSYNEENLNQTLNFALNFAKDKSDVRFNFFISPSIGNYLDWISKHKNLPRSVYLRKLIEEDMKNNKEYNS